MKGMQGMKEFIYAALASQSFKEYDAIVTGMADSGAVILLSDICAKRDDYANKILAEVGTVDAELHEAFAFAHKILTVVDMIILKNSKWVGDTEKE